MWSSNKSNNVIFFLMPMQYLHSLKNNCAISGLFKEGSPSYLLDLNPLVYLLLYILNVRNIRIIRQRYNPASFQQYGKGSMKKIIVLIMIAAIAAGGYMYFRWKKSKSLAQAEEPVSYFKVERTHQVNCCVHRPRGPQPGCGDQVQSQR